MTNTELLDALTERIGKKRADVVRDLKSLPSHSHGSHNHNYLLGYDRGLYIALITIADMKHEQDKKLDSDLDTDPGT